MSEITHIDYESQSMSHKISSSEIHLFKTVPLYFRSLLTVYNLGWVIYLDYLSRFSMGLSDFIFNCFIQTAQITFLPRFTGIFTLVLPQILFSLVLFRNLNKGDPSSWRTRFQI